MQNENQVCGELRKELIEWVKSNKGDEHLTDVGHGVAVQDRSEVLGGMMQQIRGKQSKSRCTQNVNLNIL